MPAKEADWGWVGVWEGKWRYCWRKVDNDDEVGIKKKTR